LVEIKKDKLKKVRVSDDHIKLYFQEIAKIPMFSKERGEEKIAGDKMLERRGEVFSALQSLPTRKDKKTLQIRQILNNPNKHKETVWEFVGGYLDEFGYWPSFKRIEEWSTENKKQNKIDKLFCRIRVEDLRDESEFNFYLSKNSANELDADVLRKKFPKLHYKVFLRIIKERQFNRHKYWQARIFDELNTIPILPKNISRAMNGLVEIENEFMKKNLRWVVHITKRWKDKCPESKLSFLDLIQEGNRGLYRATRRFEPGKGYRFTTFATGWIKQNIQRIIDEQSDIIIMPAHIVEISKNISSVALKLNQDFGRYPTEEEIIKAFFLQDNLKLKSETYKLTPKKIKQILKISRNTDSLDRKIKTIDGNDTDSCVGDLIESVDIPSPEKAMLKINLKETLKEMLNKILTPKEERVVILRFGLESGVSQTLEEIGANFLVTRERIRQIEAKALGKLRRAGKRMGLDDFLSTI